MKTAIIVSLFIFLVIYVLYYESFTEQKNVTTTNSTVNTRPKTKAEEITALKTSLQNRVSQRILEQKTSQVSVYFATLNDEQLAFTINDNAYYSPASMSKVFLTIELLKRSENDSNLLQTEVAEVTDDTVLKNMSFPPEEKMVPGQMYTLEEMNKRMIMYSDNNAYVTLVKTLELESFEQLFNNLGISTRRTSEDYITVNNYAKVFSILYNAEYLSKENSDYALNLLMQTEFKDGLVKKVPVEVQVAHKFGERLNEEGQQLHDCGIIYYPNVPYVLCVMTKGHNVKAQAEVIADTSQYVYKTIKTSKFFNNKDVSKGPVRTIKRKNRLYNGKVEKKAYYESLQYASPSGGK